MTIRQWLAERSRHYKPYRNWIANYSRMRHVAYIDLSDRGCGADFADAMHANATGARRWSGALADELKDVVLQGDPSS